MIDVDIRPGPEWGRFGKDLRSAAKLIEREVSDGLKKSTHKVTKQIRLSAVTTLPRSGGLGSVVASSTQFVVRTTVMGPTIRASLTALSKYDISQMDHGSVAHPVYGNRGSWVRQAVTPLWFTAPVEKSKNDFEDEVRRAIRRIINRLEK